MTPTQEDLKIEVSMSETEVIVTCSVNRIKPEAAEMFFTIGGQKYNGTVSSNINQDLTVTNSLKLRYVFCFVITLNLSQDKRLFVRGK